MALSNGSTRRRAQGRRGVVAQAVPTYEHLGLRTSDFGPAGPSPRLPPHLGDGPVQSPLRLLHAGGALHLAPEAEPSHVRGDHAAGADLRGPWRLQAPADGRG